MEQFNKDKAEGKIQEGNGKRPETNQKPTLQETLKKATEPETLEQAIKEHLCQLTEYKVNVDGEIVTYQRRDLNPRESFELLGLAEFHIRMNATLQTLKMKRVYYAMRATMIQQDLNTVEKLNEYDTMVNNVSLINDKIDKVEWHYKEMTFPTESDFALYFYQKILEKCIGLSAEDYHKSAFRSNMKMASENDVWGTRHIADACLEVEKNSYAYFQKPSSNSLES